MWLEILALAIHVCDLGLVSGNAIRFTHLMCCLVLVKMSEIFEASILIILNHGDITGDVN